MEAAIRRRVLVVDDTDDLRELLRFVLDQAGFDVLEARNGAEAVRLARQHHPDLVVMDLWMPVMDGVEAIERLKGDRTTSDLPIIALTAQVGFEIASRARAAGCDDFYLKPIAPDELLRAISARIGG
jgi:two-component system cell cycle response regulator DivK